MIYNFHVNTSGCCTFGRRIIRKTYSSSFIAETLEEIIWNETGARFVIYDLDASINTKGEVAIFTSHGNTGGQRIVRYWIIDEQGDFIVDNEMLFNKFGGDFRLGDQIIGNLYDNGDFIVSFAIEDLEDNIEYEAVIIYGENYGENKTEVSSLNATSSDDQKNPYIAPLSNNGFVAAWDGNGFQGDAQGIYVRPFNAALFPGVLITKNDTITEKGQGQTILVKLAIQPLDNVSVKLTSNDTTEGILNISELIFTPSNYDQVQEVELTGINDTIDDGNIQFNLSLSFSESIDVSYSSLANEIINFVNIDDDFTINTPLNQDICQSVGLSTQSFNVSNLGSQITQVTAVSLNQSIIKNSDITLTNINGDNWSIKTGNLSDNESGTTTIKITVDDGIYHSFKTFEINSESVDINIISTKTELCEGEEVSLLADGNADFTWLDNVEDGIAFTPNSTNTYRLIGEQGNCIDTINTQIIVNEVPTKPEIVFFNNALLTNATSNIKWYIGNFALPNENGTSFIPPQSGSYKVSTTNSNNCISYSDPYEYIITSTDEIYSNPDWSLYPNPAKDNFTVKAEGLEYIQIFDGVGNLIVNEITNSNSVLINTADLNSGVYFVQVKTHNGTDIKRLIIN
jgi:hypothetical protein